MDDRCAQDLEAKAIVEWVLGLTAEPTGDGEDFRLFDRGRSVGHLGVLVAASPRQPAGPSLVVPGLTRSWLLYHPPSAEILARLRTVVDILADLEAAGIVSIGTPGSPHVPRGAVRSLAHHGVSRALSLEEDPGEARIAFAPTPHWPAPGHSPCHLVNDVVEDEAWADADARRADPVHPGERHLFVWLDPADLEVRAAMEADSPPAPPVLPAGLDVVWVARRASRRSGLVADRIWQTGASAQWEPLAPVRRTIRPLAAVALPG